MGRSSVEHRGATNRALYADKLTSRLAKPGGGLKTAKGSVLTFTYMCVQKDRFEDNGWVVLLLYPDGKRSFDAPRELLPAGASPGDVFDIIFEHDPTETERLVGENTRLLDELSGRGEG